MRHTMTTDHELQELRAQLAAHSRSLRAMSMSTRRLQKALAAVITSARSKPTTSAPKLNRSGVSADARRTEAQASGQPRSTALERRWGNLF